MTSRDFCYWLQGFFELSGEAPTPEITSWRIGLIRNHLAMVFRHELDPSMGDKKHQDALTAIHAEPGSGPPKFNC